MLLTIRPICTREYFASGPVKGASRNISSSNRAILVRTRTGGFASQHYCWFALFQMSCFDRFVMLYFCYAVFLFGITTCKTVLFVIYLTSVLLELCRSQM